MKKKQKGRTEKLSLMPEDLDEYHIIKPLGLFHVYQTQEDLENYFQKFSGNELFLVHLGAALQWNCLAYQLKGNKLAEKPLQSNIKKRAFEAEKVEELKAR